MVNFTGGGTIAGGLFIFSLNGSPVLWWVAYISIAIAVVCISYWVYRRHIEAREAHVAKVRAQRLARARHAYR